MHPPYNNSITMSSKKQQPSEGKPISFIMSIKSNEDLRNYL